MSTDPSPNNQTIVIHEKESLFGRFGKVLVAVCVLLVLALVGTMTSYQSYFSDPNGPQEKYHSLNEHAMDKIAIIEVAGTIMEGSDHFKQQIDLVKEDESVKAVVLRINSPGGTVTYSDYLLHHLKELRNEREIPLVVSMGSLCASGGYYIAMAVEDQEDVIYAEPMTWTGSIGVILPRYELTGLMEKVGVDEDFIASGKFKGMGSTMGELSAEQRELFQTVINESYGHFRMVVKSGRPNLTDEDLDQLAQGQIFTATQAKESGLVDEIGFVEDAIERAAKLAKLDTKKVRCVKYKKKVGAIDAILGAQSRHSELSMLLDLTTPRAYYLCTTLPALLKSK